MVPITRQYRQTAPMTKAVCARNHTVKAAMKPAKKVATAHAAFDSAGAEQARTGHAEGQREDTESDGRIRDRTEDAGLP